MTDDVLNGQDLLLDACTAINLYGSRRMEEVLRALPARVVVARHVLEEVVYIYSLRPDGSRERIPNVLQPLIDLGLLTLWEIESPDEELTAVRLAALQFHTGEAATCAMAIHRGAAVATDEWLVLKVMNHDALGVPLVTTS